MDALLDYYGKDTEDTNISTNIDDYNPQDLIDLLDLDTFTKTSVLEKTNKLIQDFQSNNNKTMEKFFKAVQKKLLQNLPKTKNNMNLVNKKSDYNPQNTENDQLNVWWTQQYPTQEDPDSAILYPSGTTDRFQKIQLYDDNHNVMIQDKLAVSRNVPIEQGQMNPNLKNLTNRIVSIDSKYRQNSTPSTKGITYGSLNNTYLSQWSSTDFNCDLTDTLKKVVTLKLYSLQVPYTWYAIDEAYGTNCMLADNTMISVPSGNYTASDLAAALQSQLQVVDPNYVVVYNSNSGKMTITVPSESNTLTFYDESNQICAKSCGPVPKSNYNLGWIMGFRDTSYTGSLSYTGESLVDTYGPRYFLLSLDDYNSNRVNRGLVSIQPTENRVRLPSYFKNNLPVQGCENVEFNPTPTYQQGDPRLVTQAQLYAINQINNERSSATNSTLVSPTSTDIFAIIPIKKGSLNSGDLFVEFSGPLQTNERSYFGPVDITKFHVKLLDDKGNVVNLNGADWSFSIVSEHLYQY